jgi:arylsulfatase
VRQGKWKLVSRHPDAWELYNLEADRTEMNNLVAKEPIARRNSRRCMKRGPRGPNVAPWLSWKKS